MEQNDPLKGEDKMFDDLSTKFDKILNEEELAQLKNYAVFVVDESGSMANKKTDVIGLINSQIEQIKESAKSMITKFCYVTFSTIVDEPKFWCKDAQSLEYLKDEDFQIRESTALFDAIGYTVSKLKKLPDINDENTSVLFMIISDGYENCSTEFKQKDIIALVKELEDTKRWTIVYLGADVDIMKIQEQTAFDLGNISVSMDGFAGYAGPTGKRGFAGYAGQTAAYFNNRTHGMTHTTSFFSDTSPTYVITEKKQGKNNK
jgi:hypothetical protein